MANNRKMAIFWIIGSLCMLMGSITAGRLEEPVNMGYLIGLSFSFMLFMMGGLLWIAVAIAMKKKMD